MNNSKRPQIICYCNSISRESVEAAIRRCKSVNAVMNATTAGLGQCGGTCRPDLEKMFASFRATGEFPEIAKRPPPPKSKI